MAEKTYSISELAAQLNLPRTTINDWLKNFAPFLEFEMKGKRKEFSSSALNVLKNISDWKNEGKSASAIQKLLEEKYGIAAEISPMDNENSDDVKEDKNTVSGNSGELMQTVHSDLELLISNIEQLNTKRIRSTRIAAWSTVIIMFFILAGVGICAYFIYLNMLKLRQENIKAQQEYAKNIQKLRDENAGKLEKLEDLRKIELDKLSKDFDIRNKKFQDELAIQKKELAEAFKNLQNSVAEQREAELIKLREKFAAEQKDALEKLIAKEKELAVFQDKFKSLQEKSTELEKNSAELQEKNKQLSEALEFGRTSLKELKKKLEEISPENKQ